MPSLLIHNKKQQPSSLVPSIPRGGAGSPIPVDTAQKMFIIAYGLNAVVCNVFPELAAKAYGVKFNRATKWCMESVGGAGMNLSLLLYLHVMKGMPFSKALAWSVWPYIFLGINHGWISKTHEIGGIPQSNIYPVIIINLLVFIANMADWSWAGKVNTFYGVFSLLSAPMLLFPEVVAKMWGFTIPDKTFEFIWRTSGYFLLAHGLGVLLGAAGQPTSSIVGWPALATGLSLLYLWVGGMAQAGSIPTARFVPWLLVLFSAAYSLLVE